MVQNEENIIDAEIVDSKPSEVNSSQILRNLESMIKSHLSGIDKLQIEVKKHKELLDDIFNNDPTFQEHTKIAKEAAKIKSKTKSEILKRPQARQLDEKVKSLKSQVKETQGALEDYLREFQRMSGLNEIAGDGGELFEIVYVPKLRRKTPGTF